MRRKPLRDPLVAVAYLRCSKAEQSLSPAAQAEAVNALAARLGLTVAWYALDIDVCGETPMALRAGFQAALGALETSNAGVLLVARRDRLGRDVIEVGLIERVLLARGASVASPDASSGSSPADVLLRRVLDATAEFELGMIRSRTRAALAIKKSRGERTGSIPYGSQLAADGVHLEPHAAEQAVLSRARQLRSEGQSVRQIQAALGPVSRTGQLLRVAAVHQMISAL